MSTRILIVDNNLIDIEALHEALSEAGLAPVVEVAMDAPAAIAQLATITAATAPELILVDLRLFVGSGLEVVTHVRRHPILGATPLVVVSSVLDQRERDACLAAGANRVDTKPRRFAEQVALAREWAALLRLPTPPSETRADHDRT